MAHMLIAAIVMAGSAAANELSEHDSPYLAMHGDDPVAWHTWSAEALEKGHTQLQQRAFDYPSQVILLAEQDLTPSNAK